MADNFIDWDSIIKDSGPATYLPVPEDDYDILVLSAEPTQTNNGKGSWKVKMEIQGGPHDKRLLWNDMTVSPESPLALRIFFQHMHALGLPQEFFATKPSPQAVADALKSRRARVHVIVDEWGGTKRNKVKKIFMPSTTPAFPSAAAQAIPAAAAPLPVAAPAPPPAAPAAPQAAPQPPQVYQPQPTPEPAVAPAGGFPAPPPPPPF